MQYRNLGTSGLIVSRICLGCMSFGRPDAGRHEWTIDETASRTIIRKALEAGINFLDTANEYSAGTSEEFVGRAIADFAHRDEIVLATKAYAPWRSAPNTGGLSRKALFQAIDDSLTRLGTDYVDLFQIHRWDYSVLIEEVMEALHDIVKAGKARYIGASSMYAWQFSKAQYTAERNGWTKFISMQPQVNLVYREEEREMIPLCIDQGVGVLPWSPLARGMLTRDWNEKTARSETDMFSAHLYKATAENDRQIVEAVAALASEHGLPRAQIAMAWLLGKPGITAPIIGATKPSHLDDAIASLNVSLSAEEIARLESPYLPHRVVGLAGPMPLGGSLTLKK
jgi:aryl-alcohol dehydrogenase-like predicted oxidoreductase